MSVRKGRDPRLSAHRVALVALCVVAGVALAASSPAATVRAAPGLTIQVVNQTDSVLVNDTSPPGVGSWAVEAGPALAEDATAEWVAALASGDPSFSGSIIYSADPPHALAVQLYADGSTAFKTTCSTVDKADKCQVQNATASTPWVVTFGIVRADTTPPAVRVSVAPSLVEESVRAAGIPVVVRSNEPARARVELIAQNGARLALLARTLKWGNRDYPLMLRLNRAGLRALDVGKAYRLGVRVTDRNGNRRTIERRVAIR